MAPLAALLKSTSAGKAHAICDKMREFTSLVRNSMGRWLVGVQPFDFGSFHITVRPYAFCGSSQPLVTGTMDEASTVELAGNVVSMSLGCLTMSFLSFVRMDCMDCMVRF